jgi:hypothetical protein
MARMRPTSATRLLSFAFSATLIGCALSSDVGKPTDQEIAQMQAWSEVVTPLDREQVTREANQHTDWAERRKVQFITGEYKKRYLHLQAHPTTHRSSTTSTSAPTDMASPSGL